MVGVGAFPFFHMNTRVAVSGVCYYLFRTYFQIHASCVHSSSRPWLVPFSLNATEFSRGWHRSFMPTWADQEKWLPS